MTVEQATSLSMLASLGIMFVFFLGLGLNSLFNARYWRWFILAILMNILLAAIKACELCRYCLPYRQLMETISYLLLALGMVFLIEAALSYSGVERRKIIYVGIFLLALIHLFARHCCTLVLWVEGILLLAILGYPFFLIGRTAGAYWFTVVGILFALDAHLVRSVAWYLGSGEHAILYVSNIAEALTTMAVSLSFAYIHLVTIALEKRRYRIDLEAAYEMRRKAIDIISSEHLL